LFEKLSAMPPDAILKTIAEFQADDRDFKIDLGVGVYRDADGNTPILSSVKQAERRLLDEQVTKTYLGSSGAVEFNEAMQRLTFGAVAGASDRITTLQTPGGSGSLRVAAELARRARKDVVIWAGEPTWANHVPLLASAGIELKRYPYYDADNKRLRFDDMLQAVSEMPAGDILLLHGCCHNPTGLDLDDGQWIALTGVVAERELLPFIDIAYQGFARGLDDDAFGVRHMFEALPEMLVASSCSKNFALYRDRVGSLSVVSRDAATAAIVRSQANNIVRTMYSMPPDHGASVVARILGDPVLREEWTGEVTTMRQRLREMRGLLAAAMRDKAPEHDFSHFESGNGMFSFIGITPEQVERMKKEYAVYAVGSSRINLAGVTPGNVGHLSDAIAGVL